MLLKYDIRTQFIRRIELLGMVILERGKHSIGDFANVFGVDEESIKKDLSFLRSLGISIHQVRSRGIQLNQAPTVELLAGLLHQYLAFTRIETEGERSVLRVLHKSPFNTYGMIVCLQRAVREVKKVKIQYKPSGAKTEKSYRIEPLLLFEREEIWRLLAGVDGTLEQFIVAKISDVEQLNEKFKRPPKSEIDSVFQQSWNTWIGKDRLPVKLKLSEYWADRFTTHPIVKGQKIYKNDSGEFIMEATVNSMMELARWIVAR